MREDTETRNKGGEVRGGIMEREREEDKGEWNEVEEGGNMGHERERERVNEREEGESQAWKQRTQENEEEKRGRKDVNRKKNEMKEVHEGGKEKGRLAGKEDKLREIGENIREETEA